MLVRQRSECTDVWLRRNIVHDWHDNPDGGSQEFWSADEVYGTMPAGTTVEQVAADFDKLWLRFDSADLTDREYAERTAQTSTDTVVSMIGDSGTVGYAPDNINEGEFFIAGSAAYVALCNIARGERLAANINVSETTVAKYIMEQSKDKE